MLRRHNNPYTLVDSTGIGDVFLEHLQRSDQNISGYKFTQQSKNQIIESLILAIEQGKITFPNIDVLVSELSTFNFETLPSGMLRYNAPSGYFDDSVISLALALQAHGGAYIIDFNEDCLGDTRDTAKFYNDEDYEHDPFDFEHRTPRAAWE